MKLLHVLILTILLSLNAYSQQEDACSPEIYIASINFPSTYFPINVNFEPLSDLFCHDLNNQNLWFNCTSCDNSPNATLLINHPYSCQTCGITICIHDLYNNCNNDNYGYGLYKVTSNVSDDYFYIDSRDCNYWPNFSWPGYGRDLWIRYDWNNGSPLLTYKIQGEFILPINNGDILSMWRVNNILKSNTSCFENFWENCLILIPSATGNLPRLVWGSHPQYSVLKYYIYRKMDYQSFVKIDSTNSSTMEYVDYTFSMNGPFNLQYYVTGVYSPQDNQILFETSGTNTVACSGGIYKNSTDVSNIFTNTLSQNYPNPFNPITVVNYSIEKEGFVSLKIFDILGREIAELVHDFQSAGEHSVTFNAVNLPSGIYIYKIVSNDFSSSRKLQLIK